jgi:hypothetical protein
MFEKKLHQKENHKNHDKSGTLRKISKKNVINPLDRNNSFEYASKLEDEIVSPTRGRQPNIIYTINKNIINQENLSKSNIENKRRDDNKSKISYLCFFY